MRGALVARGTSSEQYGDVYNHQHTSSQPINQDSPVPECSPVPATAREPPNLRCFGAAV